MDRLNRIERLKERLHATDYIAIKASEGADVSAHGGWRAERQAVRDEINRLEAMSDEEYFTIYQEREVSDERD